MSGNTDELKKLISTLHDVPSILLEALAAGNIKINMGFQTVRTADGDDARPYVSIEPVKTEK